MSLRQMDIALRVKMLWQALHSTSLWASYFRTKHIGQLHLRDVTFHRMAGPARRSWMKAKQLILQYHRIIIGDGRNTNFWHDHWIGQHCLSDFLPDNSIPNSTITVKDFLQHPQREEIDLLNSFIPAHLKTAIVHTTLNLENDIPVWSLSSSGQCTVASTKKVLTDSPFNQSAIQWASLWSPWLPIKISVHIWKILHNCLPVDRNIQRLGIQISSKCSCCQAPQGESLNHLFIHSELAVHIWSYFQAKGITLAGNSVATFITTAVRNIKSNSAHGLLVLAVLGFSLWEIWRARNSMRYEGCAISHSRVLHQIIAKTKQVCISASYKENDIPKRRLLESFGISPPFSIGAQLKIIKWVSPPWPSLKLNTDGACKLDGSSGGGGVIRDHTGTVLIAFSHFYGQANSLVAEARALMDGIHYLHTLSDHSAHIECDSQVLVRVINKDYQCPWSILPYAREIWRSLPPSDKIAHTYREGNKVADLLASLACSSKCNAYFSYVDLPSFIKGEARMDKLGIPSIRQM